MAISASAHFSMSEHPLNVTFRDIETVDVTMIIESYLDGFTLFLTREQFSTLHKAVNKHAEKLATASVPTPEALEDPRDEEERIFDRACEAAPLSYAEQGL